MSITIPLPALHDVLVFVAGMGTTVIVAIVWGAANFRMWR